MKLIFRQYLASLRERNELDVVLPDLLSELGFTVISRPTVGTRQYGVDVAAVGKDNNGKRKLYLFSIKQGDLTRADWDGNPQALRSSINDILDVYIPTRVAQVYEKLDIVICLCFGGDIHEAVRDNVTLFTKSLTTSRISFEEWNGDYLAGLLSKGILREQLIGKELRTSFQKAVAMVDEPEISFNHFSTLIKKLCSVNSDTTRKKITIIRQVYICLWVMFVWARDSGNLESSYRSSELSILHVWKLICNEIGKKTKQSEEISLAFSELVNLYSIIWDELIGEKILPYVNSKHAISVAINSSAIADVNLKLFEILGRISMRGLWILWSGGASLEPKVSSGINIDKANELAEKIILLIRNNPMLMSPITDEQSIDISTALLFLTMLPDWRQGAGNYVESLIQRIIFAFRTHSIYPSISSEYRELIEHPREQDNDYRESQTKASTLIPLLSLWASSLNLSEMAEYLTEFCKESLKHCNMQFWLPGPDTEDKIYSGDIYHGSSLHHILITSDGENAFSILKKECSGKTAFSQLSAIRDEHWQILILACRHYRLPLPPNLWLHVLEDCRACNRGDNNVV